MGLGAGKSRRGKGRLQDLPKVEISASKTLDFPPQNFCIKLIAVRVPYLWTKVDILPSPEPHGSMVEMEGLGNLEDSFLLELVICGRYPGGAKPNSINYFSSPDVHIFQVQELFSDGSPEEWHQLGPPVMQSLLIRV